MSPFGGVLFTLEVILQDFSDPGIHACRRRQRHRAGHGAVALQDDPSRQEFHPIFAVSPDAIRTHEVLRFGQVGNFVVLGLICGLVGLGLTRLMNKSEESFVDLKAPSVLKPAIGGALLGSMGVLYVLVFGRLVLHVTKPVPFSAYPMPAFFGDGYGFIEQLLSPAYYLSHGAVEEKLLILLAFLCGIKIVATCLTLGSGGSGGVIAPSLFLGATVGSVMGAASPALALVP